MSDLLTDYAMMLLREMGLSSSGGGAGSAAAEPVPVPFDPSTVAAAVRIQAVYRGYQLRNELHRQFAATRIQVRSSHGLRVAASASRVSIVL